MPKLSATPRRRRTKDQTRGLLLDGAMRVLADRIGGQGERTPNPLADVRITDALGQANQALLDGDPAARPMTTGAAYNIWPDQSGFQADLLNRVLMDTATPGVEHVRAVILSALADQRPWRTVLTEAFEVDFEHSFASPAMFAMLGLAALAPPADFAAGQHEANELYVRESADCLRTIMHYAGRRLRDGWEISDLVWAIEALEAGYLLRRRIHPDIPLKQAGEERTALATAIVGIFEAFTEDHG